MTEITPALICNSPCQLHLVWHLRKLPLVIFRVCIFLVNIYVWLLGAKLRRVFFSPELVDGKKQAFHLDLYLNVGLPAPTIGWEEA